MTKYGDKKNALRSSSGKVERGVKLSIRVLVLISFASLAVLTAACSRKQVYMPPEYSSPSARQSYPAPPPPVPPAPQHEGPGITRTPEFKKQDIPGSPPSPSQPQTAPRPAPQPVPQPSHKPKPPATGKKEGTRSPQRQASMQLVNQARSPIERGKPDTAIPMLEKAIQIDPKNADAFMMLARAWKQKGARKKALEFARKAELLYQGQSAKLREVYLLEADLYRELGEGAKAGQYRQKASSLPKKRSE